jgi:hypothetical protein
VAGLGPRSLQSWAADVIEILREAHRLTEQARARDEPADAEPLAKLRGCYDEAIAFGITHNRHRRGLPPEWTRSQALISYRSGRRQNRPICAMTPGGLA